MKNGLILAVDNKNIDDALSSIKLVFNYIEVIKLGLEFFIANGPNGVKKIKNIFRNSIFLDLKLFDIPNTVYRAVKSVLDLDIKMLSIHLSGGIEMLQAASDAVSGSKTMLVGVTTLTSNNASLDCVLELVDMAHSVNIPMIVCSAWEVSKIKHYYPSILTVVPGIRNIGDSKNDQKRIATPSVAISNGADFLVVGRAITENVNPKSSAAYIAKEISYFRLNK